MRSEQDGLLRRCAPRNDDRKRAAGNDRKFFTRDICPFMSPDSSHIRLMAKNPDNPKKPGKTPKSKAPNSKASRPDVQPIGPALAELLNPAINRGDAGMGSGTGLQPPPDNSWDRRAGGEAAAHRARASTRGTSDDVAKRGCVCLANLARCFLPTPRASSASGGSRGEQTLSAGADARDSGGAPNLRPLSRLRGGSRGGERRGATAKRLRRSAATRIRAGQLRHRGHDPGARSGTGKATRLHHRGGRRRGDGAAAAQQDGGARRRRHRGRAGKPDPRGPPRIQGRGRPGQNLDAASPAAPGEIRRRPAVRDQIRIRAEGRPAHRDQGTGRGHQRATTAPRCCSASPDRARPTPWPR